MIIPFNNSKTFALNLPLNLSAKDYFKALDNKLLRLGSYLKLDNNYGRKLAYDPVCFYEYKEELLKEADDIAEMFKSLEASIHYSYEIDFIFDFLEGAGLEKVESIVEINELNLLIKGLQIAIKEGKTYEQIVKLINDCYDRVIDECMYWDILTTLYCDEIAVENDITSKKDGRVSDDNWFVDIK